MGRGAQRTAVFRLGATAGRGGRRRGRRTTPLRDDGTRGQRATRRGEPTMRSSNEPPLQRAQATGSHLGRHLLKPRRRPPAARGRVEPRGKLGRLHAPLRCELALRPTAWLALAAAAKEREPAAARAAVFLHVLFEPRRRLRVHVVRHARTRARTRTLEQCYMTATPGDLGLFSLPRQTPNYDRPHVGGARAN